MVSSNNSSYYKNERKKGYIELIKDLWEEKVKEWKPERSGLKIEKKKL